MSRLATLSGLMALRDHGYTNPFYTGRRCFEPPTPRREKMPLTCEEKDKLASLHGKHKKKYVRELKEKYNF